MQPRRGSGGNPLDSPPFISYSPAGRGLTALCPPQDTAIHAPPYHTSNPQSTTVISQPCRSNTSYISGASQDLPSNTPRAQIDAYADSQHSFAPLRLGAPPPSAYNDCHPVPSAPPPFAPCPNMDSYTSHTATAPAPSSPPIHAHISRMCTLLR
jgi:hypothetical protein